MTRSLLIVLLTLLIAALVGNTMNQMLDRAEGARRLEARLTVYRECLAMQERVTNLAAEKRGYITTPNCEFPR